MYGKHGLLSGEGRTTGVVTHSVSCVVEGGQGVVSVTRQGVRGFSGRRSV